VSPLLELHNVDKTFQTDRGIVHAVRDVSLSVAPGEVVGIVGESGSGKSTIANLILGLEQPSGGEIMFRDDPLHDWLSGNRRAYRKCVQAVFQHPIQALDGRKRVEWLIAEPLVIHGIGTSASRRDRLKELMVDVNLDHSLLSRYPRELSGGQAQRVNIARALALEPELLVCDEPVSALDVSVQAQILNLLLSIQAARSMAMVFISHSLPVVRHISHRILVMYAGTIVESGDGETISGRPVNPYTRLLMGAVSDDQPLHESSELQTVRDGIPVVGCRFAPRCSVAIDKCVVEEPTLESLTDGHSTRCWRGQELMDLSTIAPEGVT
jgi:oligopeptide/dipeptide ABC transporter ATP-binding protein